MKLTESILKRLIKEAIKEEESKARGIAGLPDGVYVDVEKVEDSFVIRYVTEDRKNPSGEFGISGVLNMGPAKDNAIEPSEEESDGNEDAEPVEKLECLGAFEVDWVRVRPKGEGYAPLLYDIAMEIATLQGGGLTSGRYSVADEAQRIWDYYLYNRTGPGGDVTVIQLDNEKDSFGDGVQNDCIQNIARSTFTGDSWDTSPLSKVYRKQPVILKALGDKLRTYNFELNL